MLYLFRLFTLHLFFLILESQLPLHDVIRMKTFFVKLKTYILLHLVDVYMLRSDYDEAEKVGFKFIECTFWRWSSSTGFIVMNIYFLNSN